jgi:hypothetical protein
MLKRLVDFFENLKKMDFTSQKIDLTKEQNDNGGLGLNLGSNLFHKNTFRPLPSNEKWQPYNCFMSTYSERMETFKKWPRQIRQTPDQLALSGFYYKNVGDDVCCFSCGVGICNWETHDVVHFEHRRLSPNCKYLSMVCEY